MNKRLQQSMVYIVDQLEHGNGGVYNHETLAHLTLAEALTKTPFNYGVRSKEWGFWPVISPTEDANDAIFEWDEDNMKWDATSKFSTFTQPPCPECEKLAEVANESNRIGDFLDWLEDDGFVLANYVQGFRGDVLAPSYMDKNKLLAKYYGIDLDKVETERRALLEWIQEQNNG